MFSNVLNLYQKLKPFYSQVLDRPVPGYRRSFSIKSAGSFNREKN